MRLSERAEKFVLLSLPLVVPVLTIPQYILTQRYGSIKRMLFVGVLTLFSELVVLLIIRGKQVRKVQSFINDYTPFFLALLITFHIIIMAYLAIGVRYNHYMGRGLDFAIHEQTLWSTLNGRFFYTSLLGIQDFQGNHFRPFFLLLLPFYALWPDGRMLLFLQITSLSLTAIPMYAISRRYLRPSSALGVAVVFLVYPTIIGQYFGVKMIKFVPPLIAWAIYAFLDNRFWQFAVATSLAMCIQENVPLTIFMFLPLTILYKRNARRWLFYSGLAPLGWFCIAMYVLKDGSGVGAFSYLGGSVLEIVQTAMRSPLKLINGVLWQGGDKMLYLFGLLKPLLLILPWGSPISGLAVPELLLNLLADRDAFFSLKWHYSVIATTALVAASAEMLGLLSRKRPRWETVLTIVILLSTFSSLPLTVDPSMFRLDDRTYRETHRILTSVPAEASISTDYSFSQVFAKRPELWCNQYTPMETILSADYVLLDQWVIEREWHSNPKRYEMLTGLADGPGYQVIDRTDTLTLLQRQEEGKTAP